MEHVQKIHEIFSNSVAPGTPPLVRRSPWENTPESLVLQMHGPVPRQNHRRTQLQPHPNGNDISSEFPEMWVGSRKHGLPAHTSEQLEQIWNDYEPTQGWQPTALCNKGFYSKPQKAWLIYHDAKQQHAVKCKKRVKKCEQLAGGITDFAEKIKGLKGGLNIAWDIRIMRLSWDRLNFKIRTARRVAQLEGQQGCNSDCWLTRLNLRINVQKHSKTSYCKLGDYDYTIYIQQLPKKETHNVTRMI